METTIINQIIGAIISIAIMYVGFINKLRTDVELLKEKSDRLEKRQDSHSKKNDEIISLITSLKVDVIKQIGDVVTKIGKMSSDIDNISQTFAVYDDGVTAKKKRKKKA
jgi:CII-binding regulator of phage lambda lysogenization HflD